MDEWLATIKNPDLVKMLKNNIVVSGGSIASMLLHEDVNDYDVYIKDSLTLKLLAAHYSNPHDDILLMDGDNPPVKEIWQSDIGQWQTAIRNLTPGRIRLFIKGSLGGLRIEGEEPYTPRYFSPNAISLSDKVQIVLRFHGSIEEIHSTFDFIHATNYWTYAEGVVLNLAAMESLLTRQLKYQGSKYPVTSIIRSKKFINRKWNITAGEYLKIMFQISQLDLTDIDVLEDQLIGVDVAYFEMLIQALRNIPEGKELTANYLGALIDKIFDGEDVTN